ncbi:hypothetical protein vseg_017677 [Gypsophila vaccaria]
MILHCNSCSKDLVYNDFYSPSKLHNFYLPFKVTCFNLGFNNAFDCHNPPNSLSFICNSHSKPVIRRKIASGLRVFVGFKVHCVRKSLVLPSKTPGFVNGKRKKYGGCLPSLLKSLNGDEDVEKVLESYAGKLNPKECTVILKEQRKWERVLRIFDWVRSQEDYVANVIHYNVVLRSLGRAQRWDELRLYWIEMARGGVMPTNNTYSMLVDVYGKAGLVEESLLWIKHMRIRGLFPDEVTMSTVVKVLKDARQFDMGNKFYKDWRAGKLDLKCLDLSNVNGFQFESDLEPISLKHFLSTELFKIGGRHSPLETAVLTENMVKKPRLTATYNTLIDLYGKAGRLSEAADVFAEMLRSGVAPDRITFNTMIHICGTHGNLLEAEALLQKMEERGLSPDTKTYNTLISLYAQSGDVDAALQWYRKIREINLFPDVVTHRAVLHILCENQRVNEVETLICEMEKRGLQIDEHSIPGIIKMYVNSGFLERARMFFDKCQVGGGFSTKTYAAIMDVYAEKGHWAEAEKIFYAKRDLTGKKNDVLEYNVVIKAFGKGKLYEKALSVFKSMRNIGTWPDECTYNSLVQMLAGGDLADLAKEILDQMQEAGLKPHCQTFSSLIACYVRLGLLSDAVDIFHVMPEVGSKPNEVVYGALIDGFAEAGRTEEALQYYKLMVDNGITANQIVLTSLIKAYSKGGFVEKARETYESLKRFKGGPDIVASNSMISLYAELGIVSEASVIFDKLRQSGHADGVTYATMMTLYKNMGMLDEAVEVAEEMKQSGLLTDCVTFTKVMACYATNGQLADCGELLKEMVNQNVLPDGNTFKVLFTVLKKGGMSSEAVQQLQEAYREGRPYARHAIVACVFSAVGFHALAIESCETFAKPNSARLDPFAYNAAIYVYGTCREIDNALNLFMRMQDEEYEPDVVTYIHLVECYGKASMVEGVKRVYGQLKSQEIETNDSLYNAIINAYVDANRPDLAEMVSQEMSFGSDVNQYSETEIESESGEET